MPGEKKKDEGRVVYSRLRTDGGEAPGPKRGGAGEPPDVSAPERRALVRTLVPLTAGFAMLIALVFGLGVLSVGELKTVSDSTASQEFRLTETLSRLLKLRLALIRLDNEARARARIEAGTARNLIPPLDLRLRNARAEVEDLLPRYGELPQARNERGAALKAKIERFVEITRDLNRYSLEGFEAHRDIEAGLVAIFDEVGGERTRLAAERDEAIKRAGRGINSLKWMAALTGLVVAAATVWEVLRRFRQMRRNLDALRRERQFSAQILEGLVSAIAALDHEDRIRTANAAFYELFPRARAGLSVYDDFATPEGRKLLAAATAARVERATYRGRWRLPREGGGGGDERSFDVYAAPLEIDGEPGQLLALVDVTEAARAEHDLRRQESLAAVGRAAAQVAHEIKNPLGSIRLGVAMLRDMAMDRDAINTIDLVERGIEHLSKLTLDVTQFSRRRQLSLSEVELHDLLDESLDLVADKIQEKRTPLEKHFSEEAPRAQWDEDQLRQVFVNLFANALDASPAGAPLRVTTERTTGELGGDRDGDRGNGAGARRVPLARVHIADQGAGMDDETRARIFEPFFTTKKRGTGLGLAIAKQIVEQHGGRISVTSAPGQGTRFTVDLPLSNES